MTNETIIVNKDHYEELVSDSQFLEALRASGVDNWAGFDMAQDLVNEWEAERPSSHPPI